MHEVAHHRNGDVREKPDPEEFERIAAYVDKNRYEYATKESEIRADVFAELMREQIDRVTWPHAMDLEFKLKVWLRSIR